MSKNRKNQEPETMAEFRINHMLIELGWRFEDKGDLKRNARFRGHFPSQEVKDLLGNKVPDYHLYQDDSDMPIAIIEAKRPDTNDLSEGLAQARDYAERIGNKNMLIFCSNGAVTMVRDMRTGEAPMIGGQIVQDFLTQESIISLLNDSYPRQQGRAIDSIEKMMKVFSSAGNSLRKAGVAAGMDSLREFCALLFVKIMMERNNEDWKGFSELRGNALLSEYKRILEYYIKSYGGVINQTVISDPRSLEALITGIKDLDFSSTDMDIKGGAYEYFLSRYSIAKDNALGQFFTPRHITRMISRLLDPKLGKTVFDPFCGTGGMLVGCYSLLKNQVRSSADRDILNKDTLFGEDISEQAGQLAKMNMVLLGDGHNNIDRSDNLRDTPRGKYDYVVTNIPFNVGSGSGNAKYKDFRGYSDSNTLAVLHCMHSLKKGGSAAIILPSTIAFESRYADLRRYLRDNSKIRAVIRLPDKLFIGYATARTFLLLLDNVWEEQTDEFPFVNLRYDGFSQDKKREAVPGNQIPSLLEASDMSKLPFALNVCAKGDDFNFFVKKTYPKRKDGLPLRDLIKLRDEPQPIDPDKYYAEPALNSAFNKVKVNGELRLGENLSNYEKGKIIAQPGDIIIATLHTQSGNGLFAFADREYVITTQIAGEVREDLVGKEYLAAALRKILPIFSVTDLVGRETYSPEEILSVRIPFPPEEMAKIEKRLKKLEKESELLKNQLRDMVGYCE